MKRIAITQRLVENEIYHEIRESLDINYCKLIYDCGFIPVVLPYEVDFKSYFDELSISGVILSGGNNLNIVSNDKLSYKRDSFEFKLIDFCIGNEIPIYGMCRGMQLIAHYFGSKLIGVENQINIKHSLSCNASSKYYNYLVEIDQVNSFHDYGVSSLSEELIISATDSKGNIKAIEHQTHKVFAQMWHSERKIPFDPNEKKLIKEFFNENIETVCEIAKDAGNSIMKIYNSIDLNVELKKDESPLSEADILSNEIISKKLKLISNYPILSEESIVDYDVRKNWKKYWLIDPLDGTKEFISKKRDFTVNISLILNNEPILGIIYAPYYNDIYFAIKNHGSFKNNKKIFNNSKREKLVGTDSFFHSSQATSDFFIKNEIDDIKKLGSSLKFCELAAGEVDVYPRFNGSKEWDIAAAHIILKEAGCNILDLNTMNEPKYNKKNLSNNYFLAFRNDLKLNL